MWTMIPKIRKVRPEELCDGMHIMGYKYVVTSKDGNDIVFTLGQAIRYWLWHCGVPAKIAFLGIRGE